MLDATFAIPDGLAADSRDLVLAIWREVCQHLQVSESLDRLATLLGQRLPLGRVVLRRFDTTDRSLETVAIGDAVAGISLQHDRHEISLAEFESLIAWGRERELLHADADEVRNRWPSAIPAGVFGDVLIGALFNEEGVAGLMILSAAPSSAFSEEDRLLAAALLEPFAVALQNDRRIQEMTLLREVAEADRQTLLTKLGRQDINEVVIGAESGLAPVMQRVEQVAPSDVPVLIFGETGSGKEVVARAVHSRSRRARGPFLRVNCGAIPPELIDSELFGHERGSFTGAVGLRKGWFERADGGTLFLDEIGELPAAAQVRLLRILQDGSFERVGGQKQLKVDVRIVAATHRDLFAMTQTGAFRQDLWYRIAVFPIDLPALRDRPGDISDLAAHFAARACRRFGFPQQLPTSEDLRLLAAYPWPGNVRELAAVIDRAAILGEGRRLDIAKALGITPPAQVPVRSNSKVLVTPPAPQTQWTAESFPTLNTVMAQHIEAALLATHGRIEGRYGAAKLLGINPHTLRARMRKLKINWAGFREDPAAPTISLGSISRPFSRQAVCS